MKIINSTPQTDGYHMPAEFERHKGTIMIWPVRPGSWPYGGIAAKKVFSCIARRIALHERMYMLVDNEHMREAEEYIFKVWDDREAGYTADMQESIRANLKLVQMESDDAWARDVGPTYVVNNGHVRGVNWKFNAWGGEYDGLYASWDKDDRVASSFCSYLHQDYYDASPFVLEGGAIHTDGQGTVIVTERCLLSPGRNPGLTKEEIENNLKKYLGARKIIWIPYGIYNDETNEHVDNVCAFTSPGNVVLAWTDDKNDPQYAYSSEDLKVLSNQTDASGRKICVHKLHIPSVPVTVTQEEIKGYVFEENEDAREAGERLAASYVNFYIANKQVLVPQFGDVNDKQAIQLLSDLFPDREVIGIYARDIILGGGNIHCITQQIPKGGKK